MSPIHTPVMAEQPAENRAVCGLDGRENIDSDSLTGL
jgi:hypothetical protein